MKTYVRVAVGGEHYAIGVEQVREVAEAGDVVAVPGAGPNIAGIRHLHGEVLPVVRLSGLLGAPGGASARIVVVEDAGRRAGLGVDVVDGVGELPEPDATGNALTRGAVLDRGALVGVLDVRALLDAVSASVA
ncbi:MAG: purine-binding chemotaxis protein CheW [Solirubrobacteraceae bacterium]|nr:purine-binding chemotaxis protein CheW [Solirubrobacteraceae bacterium]